MKSTLLSLIVASLALGAAAEAAPLKVGDAAPAVTGVSETGAPLDFAAFYKKQPYTLVYFFPRAFTSGCTKQGCSLRDAYDKLAAKGVAVLGVSTDTVDKQADFKDKEHFPFTLIADPNMVVIDAFGVPTHAIPVIGTIASRQAYLIHKGRIVWCDYHASTSTQADDVLKVLEGMPN